MTSIHRKKVFNRLFIREIHIKTRYDFQYNYKCESFTVVSTGRRVVRWEFSWNTGRVRESGKADGAGPRREEREGGREGRKKRGSNVVLGSGKRVGEAAEGKGATQREQKEGSIGKKAEGKETGRESGVGREGGRPLYLC